MRVFEIRCDEIPIGHSALELGDPPMGVAFGRFVPLPAYSHVQAACIASTKNPSQKQLVLTVRQPDGSLLTAHGVGIDDLGEGEIEVTAIGIPYPLYEQIFPKHVQAYQNQFSSAG